MTLKMAIVGVISAALVAACSGNSADLNEGSVRAGFAGSSVNPQQANATLYAAPAGLAGPPVIDGGDFVMITALSGYICDFRENGLTINAFADSNRGAEPCLGGSTDIFDFESRGEATRGEIAITARYEVRGTTTDPAEDRVIFFSDDVRETGQFLNFANLPVYGPVAAPKASSILKLQIFELDAEENKENAAVLNKLAELGALVPSPVAGGAFSVLSKLGTAFVTSNKDDREFSFELGFDPTKATPVLRRNPLRAGYYALIRRERRDQFDHFDDLVICPAEGILAEKSAGQTEAAACAAGVPYHGSTWLLLRVTEEDQDVVEAQFRAQLLSTLQQADIFQNGGKLEDLGAAADDLIERLTN